jgi:hypothetical protein
LSYGYDTTIGTVVKERGCALNETKYDWAKTHVRDPQLAQELEVKALPALSVANMRELLQTTMPLPQLSPDQATHLVVKFLVNPSRVTRSRHFSQSKKRAPI